MLYTLYPFFLLGRLHIATGQKTEDFVDVPKGHSVYEAVRDLKQKGIFLGYPSSSRTEHSPKHSAKHRVEQVSLTDKKVFDAVIAWLPHAFACPEFQSEPGSYAETGFLFNSTLAYQGTDNNARKQLFYRSLALSILADVEYQGRQGVSLSDYKSAKITTGNKEQYKAYVNKIRQEVNAQGGKSIPWALTFTMPGYSQEKNAALIPFELKTSDSGFAV